MGDHPLEKLHDDAVKNLAGPALRRFVWPVLWRGLGGAMVTAVVSSALFQWFMGWVLGSPVVAVLVVSLSGLVGWIATSLLLSRRGVAVSMREVPDVAALAKANVASLLALSAPEWNAPWTLFYADIEAPLLFVDDKSVMVEVVLGTHQRLPPGVVVTEWQVSQLRLGGAELGHYQEPRGRPLKLDEWGRKNLGVATFSYAALKIATPSNLEMSGSLRVWIHVPGRSTSPGDDKLFPLELSLGPPRICGMRDNGGGGAVRAARERAR